MMAKQGKLFVISGPSGAGKSTVVKQFIKENPNVFLSVSCTTRAPRGDDTPDVTYHFISEEKFRDMLQKDGFLEWAQVYSASCFYGSPREPVEKAMAEGRNVILEIDIQGYRKVLEKRPDAVGIFICPSSFKNLEQRLRARKTETEERLNDRLRAARGELVNAHTYDYLVVNHDWNEVPDALEKAVGEITAIMKVCEGTADAEQIAKAESCRPEANADVLELIRSEIIEKYGE